MAKSSPTVAEVILISAGTLLLLDIIALFNLSGGHHSDAYPVVFMGLMVLAPTTLWALEATLRQKWAQRKMSKQAHEDGQPNNSLQPTGLRPASDRDVR